MIDSRFMVEDGIDGGVEDPGRVERWKKVGVESCEVDIPAGVSREGRDYEGPWSHQLWFAGRPATVDFPEPIALMGLANQIGTAGIPAEKRIGTIVFILLAPFDAALYAGDVNGASR